MKKKTVILLSALAMSIFSGNVIAEEGKLTADVKSVYVFDGKDSGWFYAKVSNETDTPLTFDESNLIVFSEDDEVLLTQDYINTFPTNMTLQPGEYTYVSEFLWDSALENATIGEVKYSIQTGDKGTEITKIPCEVTFEINGKDSYDNYAYVTFTNESEDMAYDYYVTVALMDEEGNVCFVEKRNLDTIGVGTNSTVTLKIYIDQDLVDYYEAHNIVPISAEAMVSQKID